MLPLGFTMFYFQIYSCHNFMMKSVYQF